MPASAPSRVTRRATSPWPDVVPSGAVREGNRGTVPRPPREILLRRSALCTPVITLALPGTGRSVTLIGTMHVGQPAYYQAIHDRAAALEAAGALVQYEALYDAPDSEWEKAAPDERAARDALNRGLDYLYSFAGPLFDHLGWAGQRDELRYEPSWEHVDISDLDLIRAAGPAAVLARMNRVSELAAAFDALDPHLEAAAVSLAFRFWRFLPGRYRRPEPGTEHHDQAFEQAVVHRRNQHALAALPPGRDAVLIWGSGHLPGMTSALEQAGFRRRAQEWLPAGRLPGLVKSTATAWAAVHRAAFSRPRKQGSPAPAGGRGEPAGAGPQRCSEDARRGTGPEPRPPRSVRAPRLPARDAEPPEAEL